MRASLPLPHETHAVTDVQMLHPSWQGAGIRMGEGIQNVVSRAPPCVMTKPIGTVHKTGLGCASTCQVCNLGLAAPMTF